MLFIPQTKKPENKVLVRSFPTKRIMRCLFVMDLRVADGLNQNSCFTNPMRFITGPC